MAFFNDNFHILKLNPERKVFDRIDRILAQGETWEDTELLMDINSELWSVAEGDKVELALATTLALDGSPDDGTYNPNMGPSLLDKYEYVVHGLVYAFNHKGEHRIEIDVSFGGLLMRLTGDPRHLKDIQLDQNIFCLMKKIPAA